MSTILVNNIKDTGNNTLLTSDGSGNISGDLTNTPAFFVRLSSNQSMPSGAWTKVQFDTEDWDTNDDYDNTTNYRFTPTIAGKYFFNYAAGVEGIDDSENVRLQIYLNGDRYRYGTAQQISAGANADTSSTGSTQINMNGSTDYIEIYLYHNEGGARDLINNQSFLSGFRIIGA